MTATLAPTAAPPYAIKTWVDRLNIYVEFPSANGPCVVSYPKSTGGLAQALAFMNERHSNEGHGEIYLAPSSPILDRNGCSVAQRQSARDILKRMKII